MKKREDLLKSKGYWISKLQMDLYRELNEYMEKSNMNRTELARQLNVTKGYVTQVLNGDFNHKISKLVELSLAIGKVPILCYKDVNQYISDDELGLLDLPESQRPEIHLNFSTHFEITNSEKETLKRDVDYSN